MAAARPTLTSVDYIKQRNTPVVVYWLQKQVLACWRFRLLSRFERAKEREGAREHEKELVRGRERERERGWKEREGEREGERIRERERE